MAATRREGQRGQSGPGSRALTALVLIAIPGAAALGALLDGTPSWIVAFAAAGVASMVALASIARSAMPQPESTGNPAVTATTDPRVTASEEVLRRATEVRCAERTAILENLLDAVVLVDAHGETRFANLAARRMLGEGSGIAGTRAAIDALPPQVLRAVQGVAAAAAGERRRIECELRDPNATPVVITVTGVREGADGLATVVVRDVRAEREADRIKSDFVAKASHELRTPLASLRAYAEMLADGEAKDEAQRQQFAGVILSETARLSALVDRMLDINRIESGMARANYERVDLCALADECVSSQQAEALRRGISMSVERRSAGATALVDRNLMKQVMLNLLSNALKYTPEKGRVWVEVDIDNLARSVVVSVRDSGIGIPEHAIPRLFGKFYRVENHEKVAKGTGLGLNLCRNIVEAMHGGQIGVESREGAGSRFWFAIPLEQAGRKAA